MKINFKQSKLFLYAYFLLFILNIQAAEKPDIIESITASGKLEDDKEKELNEIILQLKKDFNS